MQKVLIANRGEIAVRIIRACDDAGLSSVAVYADVDADALHVGLATAAYALGGDSPADSYLNVEKLLAIAARAGADALHPGYGFLSENAEFAQAVVDAGLIWIGPSPESIRILGNKVSAREIAVRVGAPLVAGSEGHLKTAAEVRTFAEEHGLPLAIKAAFGGGGRGMKVVWEMDAIEEAFDAAVRESVAAFGRGECYVERFLHKPRHVEAQILADGRGTVVVVGTRDCSLQRRNQKLVEEAPAPFLTPAQRDQIYTSAKAICLEANYVGAGTVEYLLADDGTISFLEVNTRLQVEHPITEETSGVDLVLAQLQIAAGGPLPVLEDPLPRGHAFEFRINAEDPGRGFLPAPGTVATFVVPTGPGVRVDAGVRAGGTVPAQFDSLLGKLIVTGADRQQALRRARRALAEFEITGLPTVLPFHRAVVATPAFTGLDRLGVHTSWIETEFAAQLAIDPDLTPATPSAARRTITIEVDGKRLALGLPETLLAGLAGGGTAAAAPVAEEASPAELRSTMAGTVVKWLADEGATVAEGEPLLILEAMKMESTVLAHRSGTLSVLHVVAGDSVAVNVVVAAIEA
ncbi:acetyl/propionyl/methylcrotonyl-CoA carboxylase subunit alpha [Cryobacterium psychrophilum]|uniref:biotin carboxylase n=1 Tax=Cryobacterium psychrophilum TaxID=41988 RepID=A0A4Y8KS90_9MICO|nr:biotin carboxylase N-terminal domain-containing protein [Cryobacterium psychrophilum]TDW29397.1 biotin carboxyl carrier protein /biotin carboxylase [Cryobacterium psychrophilum]TFD81460.1 ATP-grasp domain-containing protein [Cryobacterium psychrophilum]